jgi:hypothetical protein
MSNDFDDELRRALKSVDPGEEFARRVVAQIANDAARSRRSRPLRYQWLSAAVAASVVLGFLITHDRQARREQQGLAARNQLLQALRVTGEKLELAYRVVNDETQSTTSNNPGA